MKIYCLLFVAVPFALHSQFTLTQQSHEPKLGTSTSYCTMNDSASGIPRSTGIGQTWDFSKFVATNNCSAVSYSVADYNMANAKLMSKDGFYVSGSNPATWSFVGYNDNKYGQVIFSMPKVIMQWPFMFGSTFTNSFGGTTAFFGSSKSPWIVETGTLTVTGSGTGTLITPIGQVIKEVLQVTTIQISTSSHNNYDKYGDLYSYTTFDTLMQRSYFVANRVLPIVTESSRKSATLPSTFPNFNSRAPIVQFEADLTSVSLEPILRRRETVAFPSPCDKTLNLQVGDGEDLKDLRIFDSRGVLLQAINVQSAKGKYEITTESFAPGVYVILIESTLGRTSKKFIVAR